MNTHEENDHFTVLENKSIGRNLALIPEATRQKSIGGRRTCWPSAKLLLYQIRAGRKQNHH